MSETQTTETSNSSKSPDKLVCQAIKQAEVEVRNKYRFLQYQDAIGMGIFLGSLLAIAGFWYIYFHFDNSNWKVCAICIVGVAFFTSLLHELEHDLIHNQYFKKSLWVQDIMFYGIWFSKLHGNPWYRREMHLKHHIVSGQKDDAEERLIGLGIPFSVKRMAVTMHPFGMLIVTKPVAADSTWLDVSRMNLSSAPVALTFFLFQKLFLVFAVCWLWTGSFDALPQILTKHYAMIRAVNILMCFPNMLRQACIQCMSNCSHYYGDIPEKSVFYQNQIMDHWLLKPFQFFCMNFAATHIVHHYIPNQPFYIRELVYVRVKDYMVQQGVRLNDFGVVFRGNAYYSKEKSSDQDIVDDQGRVVAANNTNTHLMALWLLLLSTVGVVLYYVFDQWATFCLGQRIVRKYLRKDPAFTAMPSNPIKKRV